jgi:hypothetical protein
MTALFHYSSVINNHKTETEPLKKYIYDIFGSASGTLMSELYSTPEECIQAARKLLYNLTNTIRNEYDDFHLVFISRDENEEDNNWEDDEILRIFLIKESSEDLSVDDWYAMCSIFLSLESGITFEDTSPYWH